MTADTLHVNDNRPSLVEIMKEDFKANKEKRIQQVTGIYMTLDIIGHIINVGLSAFNPSLYALNIMAFTTTIPGQLYNLLLFSTYCLHGTNGLSMIMKDYNIGGKRQHALIQLIRVGGIIFWILGFTWLAAGYLGLGFGVPPIADVQSQ